MKMEIAKIGGMTLVAGIVKNCYEGSGNASGRVVNVKIEGMVWNAEKRIEEPKILDIAFWNSEDGQKLLADRVIKANVGVGSFITALVTIKDDGKSANGINFKYSGIWTFPARDGQKELNVLVGTVASMDVDPENRFVKVSIPVSTAKDVTEWQRITFWNSEKAAMADRAKKCLSPSSSGRKPRAIIVCGEREEYNGKPNFTGFRFELIPNTENNIK